MIFPKQEIIFLACINPEDAGKIINNLTQSLP
jgi:hypothetical protein